MAVGCECFCKVVAMKHICSDHLKVEAKISGKKTILYFCEQVKPNGEFFYNTPRPGHIAYRNRGGSYNRDCLIFNDSKSTCCETIYTNFQRIYNRFQTTTTENRPELTVENVTQKRRIETVPIETTKLPKMDFDIVI